MAAGSASITERGLMYKHILLPTDGSALSESAVAAGIRFAKAIGARVTGFYVTPKLLTTPLERWVHGDTKSYSQLKAIFDEQAEQYLASVKRKARESGVRCQCLCVRGESPYEEILKAARNRGCNLIYMASHGRKGTSALVLGSETVKVLTHSQVPVLIHRQKVPVAVATRIASRRVK